MSGHEDRAEIEQRARDLGWVVDRAGLCTRFGRADGWWIAATWSDNGIAAHMTVFTPAGDCVESLSFLLDRWAVGVALRERIEAPWGHPASCPQNQLIAQLRGFVTALRATPETALISASAVADRLDALCDQAEPWMESRALFLGEGAR